MAEVRNGRIMAPFAEVEGIARVMTSGQRVATTVLAPAAKKPRVMLTAPSPATTSPEAVSQPESTTSGGIV